MAVVIETTLGDLTVDLYLEERPKTCLNFLKLCKTKVYNCSLFHTVQPDFIAQTGEIWICVLPFVFVLRPVLAR